jgi:hypothetical protein
MDGGLVGRQMDWFHNSAILNMCMHRKFATGISLSHLPIINEYPKNYVPIRSFSFPIICRHSNSAHKWDVDLDVSGC